MNFPTIIGTPSFLMPLMNVSENDKNINIKIELPGISEKDIKIESRNNQLIIKGEKKEDKEGENEEDEINRENG